MYAVVALLGLMFLLWGAAVWATFMEDDAEARAGSFEPRHRNAA